MTSYGEKHTGDLVALIDSENYIEVAIVNGNAAKKLDARVGEIIEVIVG